MRSFLLALELIDYFLVLGEGLLERGRGIPVQPVHVGQTAEDDIGDVLLNVLGIAPVVYVRVSDLTELLHYQAVVKRRCRDGLLALVLGYFSHRCLGILQHGPPPIFTSPLFI